MTRKPSDETMTFPLRIGLIGCGGIARNHLEAYREQGFPVGILCDINLDAARALRDEFFPDAKVTIEDLRGDGDHYAAYVVSAEFEGKSRVQQHQMVYASLKGRMGNELHALALQTATPAA